MTCRWNEVEGDIPAMSQQQSFWQSSPRFSLSGMRLINLHSLLPAKCFSALWDRGGHLLASLALRENVLVGGGRRFDFPWKSIMWKCYFCPSPFVCLHDLLMLCYHTPGFHEPPCATRWRKGNVLQVFGFTVPRVQFGSFNLLRPSGVMRASFTVNSQNS